MKYAILTFGCKVNQYDSQVVREMLGEHWEEAGAGARADVVVVNTCTVTAEADRQARQAMRRARTRHPGARVVAGGCLARLRGPELLREGLADAVADGAGPEPLLSALGVGMSGAPAVSRLAGHTRAFLKVQDGCDRRCSFCAVPLARGRSVSRPLSVLEDEAARVAGNGVPEIVLCGVRLNAYRDPASGAGLAGLVERIAGIPALARLRLSSLYPGDVEPGLVEMLAGRPKVCRHAHLPVQSGSDRVLRLMRRGYDSAAVRGLANALRRSCPEMGLTADVIAGFPGETDADFRATESLLEECGFHRLHVFPFSARPGTEAEGMEPVPRGVVRERADRLRALGEKLLRRAQEGQVGREMEVVVEGRPQGGWRKGVTDTYHTVLFREGGGVPGPMARLRITGLSGGELHGVSA